MITVLGSINMDLIATVDRLPKPGETVAGHGFTTAAGGKGANQALAARRAGASVRLCGAVGQGGFAELMTLLREERARADSSITTFGGDLLSPSVLSGVTQGAHMVELMNLIGMEVAVPGNHEFDFGPEIAQQRIADSRFPWLGTNVLDKDGKPAIGLAALHTVELGGFKVGFFGLLDPPRRGAAEAVRRCHRAGIKVKMITGDHGGTAAAIAARLGLAPESAALDGHEIDGLDEEDLHEGVVDLLEHELPQGLALLLVQLVETVLGSKLGDLCFVEARFRVDAELGADFSGGRGPRRVPAIAGGLLLRRGLAGRHGSEWRAPREAK